MTITSATAAIGATSYAVTGYANPVSTRGHLATTVVPGGTTGTISLTRARHVGRPLPAEPDGAGGAAVELQHHHDAVDHDDVPGDHDDAAPLRLWHHDDVAGDHHHAAPLRVHDDHHGSGDHDDGRRHHDHDAAGDHDDAKMHELGSTTIYTTTTTQPKHAATTVSRAGEHGSDDAADGDRRGAAAHR